MVFLLQMIGGRSLQVGLDQFLGGVLGTSELVRRVTKSALSQARKKLQPSAFAALSKLWVGGVKFEVQHVESNERRAQHDVFRRFLYRPHGGCGSPESCVAGH
jgi:hypothetical protein